MRVRTFLPWMVAAALLCVGASGRGQFPASTATVPASTIPDAQWMQPAELAQLLKSPDKAPVIFQVGSQVLFAEAHIPAARYAGPGSQSAGLQSLESAVAQMPKDKFIVLYCGCCPWNRCPNVGPAFQRMRALGFTHVKVLYLAHNFGDDWVKKGYPTEQP